MGISDGYRCIAEKKAADWDELQARCRRAGLPTFNKNDFDGSHPITRSGWECQRKLLEAEGRLDEAVAHEIERWLEGISIHERESEIRRRLQNGSELPDPRWPDAAPKISPEVALSAQASDVRRWTAIKELGLDKDGAYRSVYEDAMLQMYRIAQDRGDFAQMSSGSSRKSAESHAPQTPRGFVEVTVVIPISALFDTSESVQFVRYHLKYGLVQGVVHKRSYFDRGAGRSPGSSGGRVTSYEPSVRPLLEAVNLRRLRGMRKKSVWRVTGSPEVLLGRDKSLQAMRYELIPHRTHWEKSDVERLFTGELDSDFVNQSLPVSVTKDDDQFVLRFFARPMSDTEQ
jgi:hypothetical protein